MFQFVLVRLRSASHAGACCDVGAHATTAGKSTTRIRIVLLYKYRWDIEKLCHQLKSKMGERKSWASAPEAKKSHALFECLSHNLLLLFEGHIEITEGLRDEVEIKKPAGRIKPNPAIVVQAARNFINSELKRATRRTQRFISRVRVGLYKEVPWSESVARLREIWALPA